MNPLQGSGVSERSRCGAVRILELADEPLQGSGVSERGIGGIGVKKKLNQDQKKLNQDQKKIKSGSKKN